MKWRLTTTTVAAVDLKQCFMEEIKLTPINCVPTTSSNGDDDNLAKLCIINRK